MFIQAEKFFQISFFLYFETFAHLTANFPLDITHWNNVANYIQSIMGCKLKLEIRNKKLYMAIDNIELAHWMLWDRIYAHFRYLAGEPCPCPKCQSEFVVPSHYKAFANKIMQIKETYVTPFDPEKKIAILSDFTPLIDSLDKAMNGNLFKRGPLLDLFKIESIPSSMQSHLIVQQQSIQQQTTTTTSSATTTLGIQDLSN